MRQPTTIGQPNDQSARAAPVKLSQQAAVPAVVVPSDVTINTGAIVLRPDQEPAVHQTLAQLDFSTIPQGDIISIGLPAEQALQQTLDGFLARLDKKTASEVFALFRRLEEGVKDANLPEVLKRIQEGDRPGVVGSILGKFRGKNADEIIQDTLDEIAELITGRTKNLQDEMTSMERELTDKMQKLFTELHALEALKQSYSTHFDDFTVAAAVSRAFLQKATDYVDQEAKNLSPGDVAAQTRVQELQTKLRLLESRSLALEGTYTRLPADQLVIQQIEQAGVSTLQETATTLSGRFASIKMTLLAINGAFAVKSVQTAAQRASQLDKQLSDIRGSVVKDAAVTAAKAPGENRLAQAQQIEKIITDMAEVHDLVQQAEAETDQNFETARQKFAAARAQLTTMATT